MQREDFLPMVFKQTLPHTGPEEDTDTWEGQEMSLKQAEKGRDPLGKDLQVTLTKF